MNNFLINRADMLTAHKYMMDDLMNTIAENYDEFKEVILIEYLSNHIEVAGIVK